MSAERQEVSYTEAQFRDAVAKAVADLEALPGYAPISACILGASITTDYTRKQTWMAVVGNFQASEIARYQVQAEEDLRSVATKHDVLWRGGTPNLHLAYPAGASWAGFGVAITGRTGEQSAQLLALLILKHVAELGFEQARLYAAATNNNIVRERAQQLFGMVA